MTGRQGANTYTSEIDTVRRQGGLPWYNQARIILHTSDLLEWQGNSVLGHAIRWFTGQWANHTGIVLRFPWMGDVEKRRWTLEATSKGATLNLLSRALDGFAGRVYALRLKQEYTAMRYPIAAEMLKLVGAPYDYLALLRQISGPVRSNSDKLFCSEYVDAALRAVGLIELDYNGGKRLRPGEFSKTGLYKPPLRIY